MVNKKWVKILKAARKRIESGEDRFICCAIVACGVGLFSFIYAGAKRELRQEIGERLGGSYSVESWLVSEHTDLYDSFEDDFKQYRLAWIDSMIEEFSGMSTIVVGEDVYNELTIL